MLLVCCIYFTQADSLSHFETVGPGVVAHIVFPSTCEMEASRVQSQSAFPRELPARQPALLKETERRWGGGEIEDNI